MKILDIHNNVIDPSNLDLNKGRLVEEKLLVMHHEAIPAVDIVEEVGHYEILMEYPNGGKDMEWVIDVDGVEAHDEIPSWDEYEDILRYVEFSPDELNQVLINRLREKRNDLLQESDWTQVLDAPISSETRNAYREYRKALRDIPEQEGFPDNVIWPNLPSVVKAEPDPVDDAVDVLIGGAGNA